MNSFREEFDDLISVINSEILLFNLNSSSVFLGELDSRSDSIAANRFNIRAKPLNNSPATKALTIAGTTNGLRLECSVNKPIREPTTISAPIKSMVFSTENNPYFLLAMNSYPILTLNVVDTNISNFLNYYIIYVRRLNMRVPLMNKLILGDNLEILKSLESENIDLIYLDPPFFSNRNYEVIWGDAGEIRSFQNYP